MQKHETMKDVAEMLGKLTADEVDQRLSDLDSEARALKTLLRTLRARESAAHRKQHRMEKTDER